MGETSFDYSSLVSAGSGILSTIWNQFAPMSKQAKQAWNLHLQETQRQEQRQEDFFNKYQSIPAQVSQMQQAGINPALAAGGVSVGSVPSAPNASSPQLDRVDMSAILGQTLSLMIELKDAKLSRDLAISQDDRDERIAQSVIRRNNATAAGEEIRNLALPDLLNQEKTIRDQEIQKGFHEVELAGLEVDAQKLQNDYQESLNAFSQLEFEHKEKLMPLIEQAYQLEIDLKAAEIAYKRSQTAELAESIKILKERASRASEIVDAEIRNLEGTGDYNNAKTGLEWFKAVAGTTTTIAGGFLAGKYLRTKSGSEKLLQSVKARDRAQAVSRGVKSVGKAVGRAATGAAAVAAPYAGAAAGVAVLGTLYNWTGSYHDASDPLTVDWSTFK